MYIVPSRAIKQKHAFYIVTAFHQWFRQKYQIKLQFCVYKFDEEQHILSFNVSPHKWLITEGKTVTFKKKNLADTSLTKRSKWPSLIKEQWSCATCREPLRSTNHWQGIPTRTPSPECDPRTHSTWGRFSTAMVIHASKTSMS